MELEKIIKITGIEKLTEKEKQIVNKLVERYYPKIKRQLKDKFFLEIHIKEYELGKLSKRKKYSVHIKIAGEKFFEADYGDWDLARTIHKVMNKLMNEIEHEYHVLNQHSEIRKSQEVRKRGR